MEEAVAADPDNGDDGDVEDDDDDTALGVFIGQHEHRPGKAVGEGRSDLAESQTVLQRHKTTIEDCKK